MPLARTSQVTSRTNASRDNFMVNRRPIHSPSTMAGNKHSANINKGSSAYTPAITNRLKRTTVLQLISALCVARASSLGKRLFR
ncbi:hypothetical protein D3C71_1766580 [compost metagenome]